MAKIKLDLDTETFTRLTDAAMAERRPIAWQAEIMLRRALGLQFPAVSEAERRTSAAPHVHKEHVHA